MTQTLTLTRIAPLTHDTFALAFTRPDGFDFTPGQAVRMALHKDGWRDEARPFTMTSQPEDAALEFVIKSYPDHDGMTQHIPSLTPGDTVGITDPFGAIADHGPGTFIAGGAGITPFIPMLRARHKAGQLEGCTLIYSNKTEADIILREEWEGMAGLRTILTVTDQNDSTLPKTMVDKAFLADTLGDPQSLFYVCGPHPMMDIVKPALRDLGAEADNIITEDGW